MTYPYLPYAITELYCLAFAVTVLFRLNSSMGTEHEVQQLRNMIYSFAGMLVFDILWALTEDALLQPPKLLNAFINALAIAAITCGCYFWYKYIEDRLHFMSAKNRTLNTLVAVPLLAVCALDLLSIFTGWMFIIDEQNHYRDMPLFTLQGIVNYFYLLIPTIYSVRAAIRAPSRQERAEARTYSLYMVAPLLSGLLESVFPYVPLLALNIFLIILILFLMIQSMQVNTDALTGLNNRRRLGQYLEERLTRASAERPILLFIMDINNFKQINDEYGHLEGDSALRAFSAVLRETAGRYYAFIARYGGDEFCLVMDAAGHAPEEIAGEIRASLQKTRIDTDHAQSYSLTVSVGSTVCDGTERGPDAVLAEADRALYRNKKEWHAQNP